MHRSIQTLIGVSMGFYCLLPRKIYPESVYKTGLSSKPGVMIGFEDSGGFRFALVGLAY
jgi:hypothetical protein